MADARDVTLQRCIIGAYSIGPHQVIGGPDWVYTDRWDILAKAPDAMAADADLIELLIFRAMVAVSNAKEVRGKICPGSSCSQILDGLKMRLRL